MKKRPKMKEQKVAIISNAMKVKVQTHLWDGSQHNES